MILPKLVQERPYIDVPDWPIVHVWANGTVIVEEQSHCLIWCNEIDPPIWRRYEWAAFSDFPRPDQTITGLGAIRYILQRTGDF